METCCWSRKKMPIESPETGLWLQAKNQTGFYRHHLNYWETNKRRRVSRWLNVRIISFGSPGSQRRLPLHAFVGTRFFDISSSDCLKTIHMMPMFTIKYSRVSDNQFFVITSPVIIEWGLWTVIYISRNIWRVKEHEVSLLCSLVNQWLHNNSFETAVTTTRLKHQSLNFWLVSGFHWLAVSTAYPIFSICLSLHVICYTNLNHVDVLFPFSDETVTVNPGNPTFLVLLWIDSHQ